MNQVSWQILRDMKDSNLRIRLIDRDIGKEVTEVVHLVSENGVTARKIGPHTNGPYVIPAIILDHFAALGYVRETYSRSPDERFFEITEVGRKAVET